MSDYIFLYWDDLPLSKPSDNEQDTNLLHRKAEADRGEGCGAGLPTRQLQSRDCTHVPDEGGQEA